jgi:hypothetical protein
MHSFQIITTLGVAVSHLAGTAVAGTLGHAHSHMHHHAAPKARDLALNTPYDRRSTFPTNSTSRFHSLVAADAVYSLKDSYDSSNFFSTFGFYTGGDPTNGFVNYLSQADAQNAGIASLDNNQIRLAVDSSTVNPAAPGRASTRLSSNAVYTHGLFIADIAHMPSATCGVWPAFWTFGPDWPSNGEIDILEGVNTQGSDIITLHTSAGCSINNSGSQGGTVTSNTDCNAGNGNTGCGATTSNTNNYGNGFNNVGGGVYAMQWESTGIYVWFFQRDSIPADISNGSPDTTLWGTPVATFNGDSCNFDDHFNNHQIIFDTTFCGDWAGAADVWSSSGCSALAGDCNSYVSQNPGAFSDAYWLINSVKVYQI